MKKPLYLFNENGGSNILTKNLVGVFELEETGAATRYTQNGLYSLTPTAAPVTATGKIDNGCDFNGSTQYLSGDRAPWSFANTSYSMAIWALRSASGVNQGICGNYRSGVGNVEWHWYFDNSNNMRFRVSQDGSTAAVNINYGASSVDTWYHLGITYNATTGVYTPYLNGAALSTTTLLGGMWTSATAVLFDMGRFASSNLLNGTLDQFAWWTGVKSAATFSKLYNGGSGKRIR